MTHSFISRQNPLILASASPRRKELLSQIRIPFRAVKSRVKEDVITGDPSKITQRLANEKATHILKAESKSWILGADTIVTINDKVLGKPSDAKNARKMLESLSGREHSVITGFCILDPSGDLVHTEAVTTLVRFKTLSEKEISSYINSGEPFGKAGSYAIQGIGAFLVEAISGSYTNVVGLPLCALINALISVEALDGFPMIAP
jgi:septum formation protein